MPPAISVESLSKQFLIGAMTPMRLLRWVAGGRRGGNGSFAALRDVSFEVEQGEVLGLIGRNGAGKSTLLKILSRIIEPSGGRAVIHGRVGSLLEVGTGFHPELSGRENIYLNGAILGMSRSEIRSKFDEIVAFAEVDKFIDTPVKRYSSGMYTRLAFAVAAHLQSEVLIVDEVLAVGDATFQKKCLGKMNDVARCGRTVVFVSHNMSAIEGLCTRAVVLAAGRTAFVGDTEAAIRQYYAIAGGSIRSSFTRPPNKARELAWIEEAHVEALGERSDIGFPMGHPLEFVVTCVIDQPMAGMSLGIGIDNAGGQRITTLHTTQGGVDLCGVRGPVQFRCRLPHLMLPADDYRVKLSLGGHDFEDAFDSALEFRVMERDVFGSGGRKFNGVVLTQQEWSIQVSPAMRA